MDIGPEFHKNYWWIRVGIAVALLLLLYVVPVLAHSGRTDSDGGHTDSSTGEYHWHHGYPAHQHYDVDGDGLLECPYDSSIGNPEKANAKSSSTPGKSTTTAYTATEKAQNGANTSALVGWTAAGVAGVAAMAFCWSLDKSEKHGKKLSAAILGLQKEHFDERQKREAEVTQTVDCLSRKIADQKAQIEALQREIAALKRQQDGKNG